MMIKCEYPDGTSKMVSYKEIKDHNLSIIEDNVGYGLLHPGDYSEKEVNDYYRDAMKKQKARMRAIRENPDESVVWNKTHQLYELKEEQYDDD